MSEKRFNFYYERGNEVVIEDNGKRLSNKKVVDLLNKLYEENEQLRQDLKSLETTSNATSDYNAHLQGKIRILEKENEQLRQTVQHLTEEIGARENDLTIVHRKNKELQTENLELKHMDEQLREINKTIGDDLYNCRLNKNIISEKLKLWQDTLAEYDIYTIKDLGERLK